MDKTFGTHFERENVIFGDGPNVCTMPLDPFSFPILFIAHNQPFHRFFVGSVVFINNVLDSGLVPSVQTMELTQIGIMRLLYTGIHVRDIECN